MLPMPPALTTPAAPSITAHQAVAHPMRYHLALPAGWTPARSWPVLVVIPDAHRDFRENLARFAAARGARPVILVAPETLTCGGTAGLTSPPYGYTAADWKAARASGDFAFDEAGISAVLAEVAQRYHGETRAFLTGWEAGGHTVWPLLFRHPERWRAVVPVSTNYQGRWMDEAAFSRDPARATVRVRVLTCGAPSEEDRKGLPFWQAQTQTALNAAKAHGFTNLSLAAVPGQPHGNLAEAVLTEVDTVLAGR